MEVTIGESTYTFSNRVGENDALRQSFDALAQQVFHLSFADWHGAGWWGDAYLPHTLFFGKRAVANLSVNRLDTVWRGKPKRLVQLGTVMTHPDFRGRGLARWLMERALADWRDECHMMYLYANDSVRGFYPRFGFVQAQEYEATLPVPAARPGVPAPQRLDMDEAGDIALLQKAYQGGNPFCSLPMLHNPGLVMFHCGGPLRGGVYHLPALDAVAVARTEGQALVLYDVFCPQQVPFAKVLQAVTPLAPPGCDTLRLGFAADVPGVALGERHQEDTTLFVLGAGENLFAEGPTMMPLLSQA